MLYRPGRTSIAILTTLLVVSTGALGADLDGLMEAYYAAAGAGELATAIEAVVASGFGADEVASRLRAGRTYSEEVARGWSVHYNECIDGTARPYHVYIPEGYHPLARYPVLVDLHGAVSHPPYPVEGLIRRRALWGPTAETEGWILVMPHGDEGATWWSETGRANLLAQLSSLKSTYNIDENRVFLSGFSDGGTGALWMGCHDPTAWAGFIATYGHPGIAEKGPYQMYPRNLLNRPIRASNGMYDEIYPAAEIRLYVDQLLAYGIDIDWMAHRSAHDINVIDIERPAVIAFIEDVARNPHRSRVIWEASDVAVGRCDWVRIDEIADVGNNAEFKEMNIWPLKEEIHFGATFSYQGADVGFVVVGVEPWSIAHFSGVKTGDKIVRIAEFPVETGYEVPGIIDAKNPGESVEIEVIRSGETLVLEGQVTTIEALYARAEMTGSIEAVANGNRIDVTVRNVARYTLFLSGEQFDLDSPIVVTTNGVEVFAGVVEPDIRFMLEQATKDGDREAIYEAALEIIVSGGEPPPAG